MAIIYWPKHGEANTELSFAQYTDKLFGYADHASSDTAFMMQYIGTAGGLDTYQVVAGSYMLDGYLFTAAGTETVSVTANTATDAYLWYVLDANNRITSATIGTNTTGYTGRLKLWNLSNGNVAGKVADYRQVFTWGRQSVASTAAGCVDFLSARESAKTGATSWTEANVAKRFRCAYPGSIYLTFDGWSGSTATVKVFRVRGGITGTATQLTTASITNSYASYTYATEISGLMPGDYIDVQVMSAIAYKIRNFRVRYTTQDTPTASFEAL